MLRRALSALLMLLAASYPAGARAQETLCIRYEFSPPVSGTALNLLKTKIQAHLLNSQHWLKTYFQEPTRLVECAKPADVKIADIILEPGGRSRTFVGDFKPTAVIQDEAWLREIPSFWRVSFNFDNQCDYKNFLSVASAIVDYRLSERKILVRWDLADLLKARKALQASRQCGSFPMEQTFSSLSGRLKRVATMRSNRQPTP